MKKFLTTLAVLTVIATPVFAGSYNSSVIECHGLGCDTGDTGSGAFAQPAPKMSVAAQMLNAAKTTHQVPTSGAYECHGLGCDM
jgi:hypothetical protein